MDKVLERTDTFLVSIDKLFQVCTILRRYSSYLSLRAERRGKIRTHVKQLFLDEMQRLIEFANRVDASHVRRATPTAEFVSSTVPNASIRRSCFLTRPAPNSAVVPLSPVRV